MNGLWNRIEEARSRPHAAKKRIALSGAAIGTGLIAVVWLSTSLTTGAFALRSDAPAVPVAADDATLNLAGAAGAIRQQDQVPAHIEIVDAASSTPAKTPEPTTIPF